MNIDGVRVLAQEVIMETPNFVWIIAVLFVTGFVVFAAVSLNLIDSKWPEIAFIICGSFAFLWIMIVGVCGIFEKPSEHYTYKCIFEEDVSIQEIYDNYDIVGRDGDIWILEDKE